ncbi:Oxoglutarate/iron-dependent oxygenase [Cordyceps fumosorosea ARSEF 2679]|uniref:Oxoglutarate/iron-dependent oxygenase n=1 Tax=Cordyceps fumosorosea (strain ARSEF 2679) TaxID=1081104 RepID=A0A168BQT9_CORFA|nr:Oxoglutarate/iron-dependent oxygenase [Cordyceps fumosorosea ARSEF 2679]OAA70433.1 Oxoglutarate/iron-dependent oxygenase [Cordyceps fumosorosea ARSEF 2679]
MEPLGTEPAGLSLHKDFISKEQEDAVLRILREQLDWPDRKGRRSLHYGYTFSYKTFAIDHDVPYFPFPAWLAPLLPTGEARPPDQVCVQHYPPGAGIPPHADTHSAFDQLYALSLGAPVLMQFSRGEERKEVDLAPRAMMRMEGEARLHWTHGIRARKTDVLADGTVRPRRDRWSVTYRWLREGGVCECGDGRLCDTAQRRMGVERGYRWKEQEKETEAAAAAAQEEVMSSSAKGEEDT